MPTTKHIPCPECGGKGHTIGSGILDGKACEACGNTGIAMTYPFPGVDAHPKKRGGELCVKGTQVTVADVLREMMSAAYGAAKEVEERFQTLGKPPVESEAVRKCLRGLADWLKTQNWTAAGCNDGDG